MGRPGAAVRSITLGVVSLVCGCGSPRSHPSDGAPASASVTSTVHPTSRLAGPPVAPPASSCTAPFIVAPPHPDTWVDDAAASPPAGFAAWSPRPMTGPFASRDLVRPACTELTRLAAAPPFDEIVACTTGDTKRPLGPDNIAAHVLLARTARGFWAHEIAREHWPHGLRQGDEPRLARVTQLATGDRLGDGGAEITAIAEEGPPGGAQTRRVLVCGLGPSGVPACIDIRVAAGGPFHGAGSLLYRLTLGCDGTLAIAGWEGGAPVRLVHGRGKLWFP